MDTSILIFAVCAACFFVISSFRQAVETWKEAKLRQYEVGTKKVFLSDGSPAPDGFYKSTSGKVISVKNGMISTESNFSQIEEIKSLVNCLEKENEKLLGKIKGEQFEALRICNITAYNKNLELIQRLENLIQK